MGMRMGGRVLGLAATALVGAGAGMSAGGAGAAPINTAPPTIAGTVRFNEVITCRPGAWRGDPVSFAYEWLRSDSPFAAGARLRFADIYSMGGYAIACRVTATDAAGATAVATSAAQRPALGRISLRLTKVTSLPRGRVRITGVVGPKALLTAPFGTRDSVVVTKPAGARGATQLGGPVTVDARGRFTITISDRAGRRAITVRYWSGERDIWGGTEVRRTVRFTAGGRAGSGGGTVVVG